MTTYAVYLIEHRASGRRYVGITKRAIKARWSNHKNDMKQRRFDKHPLYLAMREYGVGAFTVSLITATLCLEKAGMIESQKIKEFNCRAPDGFNVNPGGIRGYAVGKRSEDFRVRCRERASKQFSDPAQRERVRKEQIDRWKDPRMAAIYTDGLAAALVKNPGLVEARNAALTKGRAMRTKHGGWKLGPEVVNAMSARMKTRYSDASEIEKQRARMAKVMSRPEWKASYKEAMAKLWANPEFRKKQAAGASRAGVKNGPRMKELWKSPEFRAKRAASRENNRSAI